MQDFAHRDPKDGVTSTLMFVSEEQLNVSLFFSVGTKAAVDRPDYVVLRAHPNLLVSPVAADMPTMTF
jgi:hypothetical protein